MYNRWSETLTQNLSQDNEEDVNKLWIMVVKPKRSYLTTDYQLFASEVQNPKAINQAAISNLNQRPTQALDPVAPLAGLANYQEVLGLNRGTLEGLPMPPLEQVEVEILQVMTPTEMEVVTMVPKEEEEEIEIMTEVRPPQEQPVEEEQVEGPLAPNVLMVLEAHRAPRAHQAPQGRRVLLLAELVMMYLNMEHIDQTSMTFLMLREECLKII